MIRALFFKVALHRLLYQLMWKKALKSWHGFGLRAIEPSVNFLAIWISPKIGYPMNIMFLTELAISLVYQKYHILIFWIHPHNSHKFLRDWAHDSLGGLWRSLQHWNPRAMVLTKHSCSCDNSMCCLSFFKWCGFSKQSHFGGRKIPIFAGFIFMLV
jgi:hypothetical protein